MTQTPVDPTATATITRTHEAPGATITYDVRPNPASQLPPLVLLGSPMAASGFRTLAGLFADRTVITYDPRGAERSTKADPATESDPRQHADDIHRVIAATGGGPVDMLASSGGAVNALALMEQHPEDVRTLVAHEPPATTLIPDAEAALAAVDDIGATYRRAGFGPAMAKFILLVSHRGAVPPDFFAGPDPDPAMFHLPATDDGTRTDPLLFQNIGTCNQYAFDLEALRRARDKIVMAVGEESEGQLARRGAEAVAAALGSEPVVFPGGHAGFLGDEYGPGQGGKPVEFAAKLRDVLAGEF